MTTLSNIEIQERFAEAVNSGSLEDLADLVSDDCVDHDPAPGQGPGAKGFQDFFAELRTVFPDLQIEVDHMIVNDDELAFAYTAMGTHNGPFHGVDPTGKSVSFRGLQISRFEDGKLVERWGSSDELGLLAQLGAAPS